MSLLLQRRTSRPEVRADVVAFKLAVKGGSADTKHLTRGSFVPVHLLKNTPDGCAFNVFKVGRRQQTLSATVARSFNARRDLHHTWRQIRDVDDLAISQRRGALDAVL